jgi:hypothetical protein
MRRRTRAWLEFGIFCVIFGALFEIHQRFHALDHWMALVWLVFLVGAGAYALTQRNSSGSYYGTPTFLGIFPPRWQRWFLGESGSKNDD